MLAHRHGEPAAVVELERVVVDLDLDQVIARRGERVVEDGRLVLAHFEVDRRVFGSEPAVDHQPDAEPLDPVRPVVVDHGPDDRRVVDRDDRIAEAELGDRAVLAAGLAQVDDDRSRLVGLELGQDPLQAVVVAWPLRQLAACRSVRKTTSFWAIVDASSTRSMARKVASRSVPPCGRVISSISFCTSA